MVESALEFLRICESENYFNIVLSMKSSNTQVMVQAYRLLVMKMKAEGMKYPLHLGVTEAGEGEDGRIKSATGIGTLLEDGLGDTVRVSLTEDPEFEIPVARALVNRYEKRPEHQKLIPSVTTGDAFCLYSPVEHQRRKSTELVNIGGHQVPRVIGNLDGRKEITPASFYPFGYNYSTQLDKWNIADQACDYLFVGDSKVDFNIPGILGLIYNQGYWKSLQDNTRCYPFYSLDEFLHSEKKSPVLNFVKVTLNELAGMNASVFAHLPVALVFETHNTHGMAELRRMFLELMQKNIPLPVIIRRKYSGLTEDELLLHSATDIGGLLIDGFGDGVWISADSNPKQVNSLSFGILQAARMRISKTEYISCPSCGRTLFDLQETTAKIRSRTDHLKGIKIGIMGCIVNGPGEMADADYGYVGSGPGKITLYKGKEVVKKSVPTEQAVNELIALIKENGDWVEQQVDSLPC
jgi:(E)-4-hydroxy-3-methylbut-2-enyl-diphosphate synthase